MLLKPKRITITTEVSGIEEKYIFNIGRYNGLDGLEMIEYATDIIKSGFNFSGSKKGLLRECMVKMGKYIEAVVEHEGKEKAVSLENEKILAANLADPEVAMHLMLQLHNYNTFFLRADNLLTKSLSITESIEKYAQKILMVLQESLSQKDSQHSTNSDESMT